MKKRNVKLIAAGLIAAAGLSACGSGGSNNGGNGEDVLSGEIQIDGSSTVYPVTEAVAEEFRREAPDVRVTVGVSGTGGGFKKFTRGEIDINNASREMKPSEQELCEKNNINYVELSVSYDGLTVVVHPENDWVDSISVEELKMIWEPAAQGKIKKWSQIREDWPDKEIHLFGPGIASGTYDYFTKAIVGEGGASRGDFTASEDDNVLVQGVSTDKYSLGFFGLAYYEENAEKLKVLGVSNGDGDGAIKPTIETVGNGTYNPLSRPIFIYVSGKGAQKKVVREFVNFYLDNAGFLSKDVGYIPLPKEKYEKEKKEFNDFARSQTKSKEQANK